MIDFGKILSSVLPLVTGGGGASPFSGIGSLFGGNSQKSASPDLGDLLRGVFTPTSGGDSLRGGGDFLDTLFKPSAPSKTDTTGKPFDIFGLIKGLFSK